MQSIYGIFHRHSLPLAQPALQTMRAALLPDSTVGGYIWQDGLIGLGASTANATLESSAQSLSQTPNGIVFLAAGRVDNRAELKSTLQAGATTDNDLLFLAYRKWGEDTPAHIYGDWAFAAWHAAERRLFLARDHYGNTALYYYADPHVFAFASDRRALLALNLATLEMDELYLAQVMTSWPAYHGERTIHAPLKRLPPAHCLSVTPDQLRVAQYWRMEDIPEEHLPRREDYVEAFSEVFREAVRCRLRSPSGSEEGQGKVAVTLSGGLDSSSVTALAAALLRPQGKRLLALTSVPLSDPGVYVGKRFGDEFPFAQATAQHAGNVDLHPIRAENITPIQAIRRMLAVFDEPQHAAGNYYWLLDLNQTARLMGCEVLLTGQVGNAGISWTGDVFSQPLAFQLRRLGWRKWAKERFKRAAPPALLSAWQRLRLDADSWFRGSAIHPDLVRRLRLLELRLSDPDLQPPRTPREQRCRIFMPGRSIVGALHAESGAAAGLEVRDPTADVRVLAFTLSVPDRVFIDPQTGLDRWLIRAAMQGLLPDEVRLNRARGRQAGDLVPRLRACAAEVELALEELAAGPAAAYVDLPHMRQVWQMIQSEDTPQAFHKAITILTRGVMAGLWVNQFAGYQAAALTETS
ncbi:MAG: hypothetical protein JW726_15300 [Anaerolineales bacterium]|nr:hypothetical protein [Anaerolineales bacterium]